VAASTAGNGKRLTIEYEGRRFERHRGQWLERGLTVPRILAQRLDLSLKNDPELLKKCHAQDFEDDPRNRGWAFLDIELFVEREDAQRDTSTCAIPGRGSATRRRKIDQVHLVPAFTNRGQRLVLNCNIEEGWRPTQRTWCFRASAEVPLRGDHTLRASATLIEDDSGHRGRKFSLCDGAREAVEDPIDGTPPEFAEREIVSGPVRCVLDGSTCIFHIILLDDEHELNKALPWTWDSDRKRWIFAFVDYSTYEVPIRSQAQPISQSRPFLIELRCTLRDPPRPELQPEYVNDPCGLPGGLPSLGKRSR
jgi:hypothetical protein